MFNMQKNDPWVIFLQNEQIILQLGGHYGHFSTEVISLHYTGMDRDLFQGRTGRYHVYRLSEIAVL
jgi:hypothetical protein